MLKRKRFETLNLPPRTGIDIDVMSVKGMCAGNHAVITNPNLGTSDESAHLVLGITAERAARIGSQLISFESDEHIETRHPSAIDPSTDRFVMIALAFEGREISHSAGSSVSSDRTGE